MTKGVSDLGKKIIELTKDHWDANKEPLLLSNLGSALKSHNYKSILSGRGLRRFIDNEVDGVKIAAHPSQFARIGVFPAAVEFEYKVASTTEQDKLKKNRRAFLEFIEVLAELPPSEIESITIPTRVLVRLLEGK